MNTARKALIGLLLVGVVAALALLLFVATGGNQGFVKDFVVDLVASNVDGHPTIDAVVNKVPNDCLQCHSKGGKRAPLWEDVERGMPSGY